MFKDIPENIKIIFNSAGPLAIVLILFLLVGNFGISKVVEIRGQIDQSSTEQKILTQKINILQTVSSSLGKSPDLATSALPAANSALAAITQLKNLAVTDSVILSSIKSGSEVKDPSGLSRADISFEVTGTRGQIVTFLKDTKSLAPITAVDSIKLNESGGVAHGTVAIRSFWAPLPSTLPAVTTSLSDLTPDEQKVLTSITSLAQPIFLALPPAGAGGKTDPFSP